MKRILATIGLSTLTAHSWTVLGIVGFVVMVGAICGLAYIAKRAIHGAGEVAKMRERQLSETNDLFQAALKAPPIFIHEPEPKQVRTNDTGELEVVLTDEEATEVFRSAQHWHIYAARAVTGPWELGCEVDATPSGVHSLMLDWARCTAEQRIVPMVFYRAEVAE